MKIRHRLLSATLAIGFVIFGMASIAPNANAKNNITSTESAFPAEIADTQPLADDAPSAEIFTIRYSNEYWGISRASITYLDPDNLRTHDTGALGVYMNRDFAIPSNSTNIYINVYLDARFTPSKVFYFSHWPGESITINSAGTAFNPSI